MRLIIEQADFQRLSQATRNELLDVLFGHRVTTLERAGAGKAKSGGGNWRHPVDITLDTATRLLHGVAEPHRQRMELFARKGGRVSQKDLLAITGDKDLRQLSHLQAVLTRRLRRHLSDPEKRIHLIGWDFESAVWDKDHATLVDGIYYVTPATTRSLQAYFGIKPTRKRSR